MKGSSTGSAAARLAGSMTTLQTDSRLFYMMEPSTLGERLIKELRYAATEFARNPLLFFRTAIPDEGSNFLVVRLARQLAINAGEVAEGPLFYLRSVVPERGDDVLLARLAREAGRSALMLVSHPLLFLAGAFSTDQIGVKRRRLLRPVLAGSAVVHGVIIVYLVYMALLSPFFGLRVVSRPYRSFDPNLLLVKLRYPPGMFSRAPGEATMTLEEIRERGRKRREEAIRREAEKRKREEREKAEAEKKAAKEKEEAEKAAAQPAAEFGVINEAPIKDAIGKVYAMYQSGQLDVNAEDLSIMCSFRIARDGSIPKDSIKLLKSSGNKVVDTTGLEVLWLLGESKGLGPLASLSSNTIRLDMTDTKVRLTITGFAPTRDEAERITDTLNILLKGARLLQKNSDGLELLAMMRVTNDRTRVDADLTLSRTRASEMMRARFNKQN